MYSKSRQLLLEFITGLTKHITITIHDSCLPYINLLHKYTHFATIYCFYVLSGTDNTNKTKISVKPPLAVYVTPSCCYLASIASAALKEEPKKAGV